ncbi:MAG TPA: FG-GAP-like repeat-containing protein, partial [Niastella sp.]
MHKHYLLLLIVTCCFINKLAQSQTVPFTFDLTYGYTTPNIFNGIASADFDGDGKSDVVGTNRLTTTISVYKNITSSTVVTFAPRIDFSLGGVPTDIIAGDVDHDGKPDIVVKTNNQNVISIFRNTSVAGTISFAQRIDLNAITLANNYDYGKSMALGNINGDSLPDIVSVNSFFQTFSVFKNTSTPGNISFEPKTDFPSDTYPSSVVIQDFDRDGKEDITIVSSGNFFDNFRNTGSGNSIALTFVQRVLDNGTIKSMIAGDYDQDGKPDIATVSYGNSRQLTVFRNTGSPGTLTFAAGVVWPFTGVPNYLHDGDFDGDGKKDLVVIIQNSPGIFSFYRNIGSPGLVSFAAPQDITITYSPVAAVTTELNNDGKPDLVAIDNGSMAFFAFRNTWHEPFIRSFTPAMTTQGTSVTLKGVNFTGVTEVRFGGVAAASYVVHNDSTIVAVVGPGATGSVTVTNSFGTHSKPGFTFGVGPIVSLFTPTIGGSGTIMAINGKYFTNASGVAIGNVPVASFFVINDSTISAVVGTGATGDVSVTTPFGTGSKPGFVFGPVPSITAFTPTQGETNTVVTITGKNFSVANAVHFGGIAAASFTIINDSTITAVVGAGESGIITVSSDFGLSQKPGFVFGLIPIITSFSPLSDTVGATVTIRGRNFSAIAGDNIVFFGAVKAIVSGATDSTLAVIVPAGATYQPMRVITNGLTAYADQRFSIKFAGATDSLTTAATFGNRILLTADHSAIDLGGSDLDGDGKADLVTMNPTAGTLSLYRNTSTSGAISFAPPEIIAKPSPAGMSIGDIDNDGKPDLVVTSTTGAPLTIYRNTGSPGMISFDGGTFPMSFSDLRGIAIRDLDYDGKPDLVVDIFLQGVGIYRNNSVPGAIIFDSTISAFSTGSGGPRSTLLEDINRDGKADLCLINNNGTHDSLYVFVNSSSPGAITFDPRKGFTKGGASFSVLKTGDL